MLFFAGVRVDQNLAVFLGYGGTAGFEGVPTLPCGFQAKFAPLRGARRRFSLRPRCARGRFAGLHGFGRSALPYLRFLPSPSR